MPSGGWSGPPWAVLQHEDDDGPGLLGEELAAAGCPVDVVRVDRGEPLPAAGAFGALVVLGGRAGVHDDQPWLAAERELIETAVGDGKPVLGICLGAQQLAAALGAEVRTGPAPEIGVLPVVLTTAGRRDPVLGPEYGGLGEPSVPVVEWHSETFDLPEGAVQLAGSRSYPMQAFRLGDVVYGLQFHAEVDRAMAEVWERDVPAPATFRTPRLTEATVVGRRVLRRFVDRAVALRGSSAGVATGA